MIQLTPVHPSTDNPEQFERSELREMIRIDERETRDYRFYRVTESEDLFNALKLVQDVYIQEGYVEKSTVKAPCRILKHHHHEDTAVFVGKKDGKIAFTVSLFPDTPWGLPMDAIYKEELDRLRSLGRRIGEVGCLATHQDYRTGSQNSLMHGNKIMFKHAMEILNLDDLVIVVHPRHALVYKEVLLFEEMTPGAIKNYPKVNNNPAVALRLNLHNAEEKLKNCYQNTPLENNLYHFFFVKNCTNIENDQSTPSIYGQDNLFFPTAKVP